MSFCFGQAADFFTEREQELMKQSQKKPDHIPRVLHIPVRLHPLVAEVLKHRQEPYQTAHDCLAICLARGLEGQLRSNREREVKR